MGSQRSKKTEEAYREQGRRHLRRAEKRYPDIDPLSGLIRSVKDDPTVIKPATARLYKQELIAGVDLLIAEGKAGSEQRSGALHQIELALEARTGQPDEPRTASRKVTDASEAEALTVFRYLAKRARGRINTDLVCMVALYIYIVPRLGGRPIEWMDASVEGTVLTIRNAKFGNGRAGFSDRTMDIAAFEPRVIEAIKAFAIFAPLSVRPGEEFEAWRNRLAELLARACAKCGVRRLSLYSFRHVALATWKKAGLAPWEIAALAGHASRRSASAYARKGKGWAARDLPRADPERVAALEAGNHATAAPPPEDLTDDAAEFVFDDYDQMTSRKKRAEAPRPPHLSDEDVRSHHESIARRGRALLSEQRREPFENDEDNPTPGRVGQ